MSLREARGYALGPDEGEITWFLGGLLTWKASSEQTAGQYDLVEQLGAKGFMAPPHIHDSDSEGFYVLEGEVSVTIGDQTRIVPAGSFAFVPPKVPHAFEVVSPQARILTIITPAGLRKFFEEVGEAATTRGLPPPPEGPPDVQRLTEIAARHGITIFPPPSDQK